MMEDVGNIAYRYRGEGNCAIVFADLRTLRVCRLVKNGYTQHIRQHFSSSLGTDYITSLKIDNYVRSKLESVINFVDKIMNPLLSHNYAVIPELISIPKGFGENAIAAVGDSRPAQRKKSFLDKVDPDVLCGLVLPDCCFVGPAGCGSVSSSESDQPLKVTEDCIYSHSSTQQPSLVLNGCDTYLSQLCRPLVDHDCDVWSPEISVSRATKDSKPSLYCVKNDVPVLGKYSRQNCDNHARVPSIIRCHCLLRHCQFDNLPAFCGQRDHSRLIFDGKGNPHNMDCSRSDNVCLCVEDPDSTFTLSIEIKPKKAFKIRRSSQSGNVASDNVCKFCMHQHLKIKSGKWPETSSYCPLDLFSGDKRRMKHALISLIKTPQNNLKICKNGCEVYGSDIRHNLGDLLHSWFPANPKRRQKLVNVFIDLIIETLLKCPASKESPIASKISDLSVHYLGQEVQKCSRSSFVHSEQASVESLPIGCVLERIQSLQTLDTLDIEGIYPIYNRLKKRLEENPDLRNVWCLDGPFLDESWLDLDSETQLCPESDEFAVNQVKRFLVSKTLQDCSIIVAIKPASKSDGNGDRTLTFEGDSYHYSIGLIDLEPKAFDKVETYFSQISDIKHTYAQTSLKY